LLADPFLLNPPGSAPSNPSEHVDPVAPHHDTDVDAWVGPFAMGPINTRVVRRTAALLKALGDAAYSSRFSYQEYMRFGRGPLAAAVAAGVSVGMGWGQAAMRFKTGRALARAAAVSPGQGPSERTMDSGSFRCELVGRTASGKVLRVASRAKVTLATARRRNLSASRPCAGDAATSPSGRRARGGVLTPASGLGLVLGQRLVAAGITLEPMPLEHCGSQRPSDRMELGELGAPTTYKCHQRS
jgi:short subunit dehydrogenase-like uncharacterized protein